jgi:hypothetical protein
MPKVALLPQGISKNVRFFVIQGQRIVRIYAIMVLKMLSSMGKLFCTYSELHVAVKTVAIFRDVNYNISLHEKQKMKL